MVLLSFTLALLSPLLMATPVQANALPGQVQTLRRPVAEEFSEKITHIPPTEEQQRTALIEFPGQNARFVRLVILKTSGNTEPCLDELEVYGPDSTENLALASRGAVASASSLLPGYAIHQVAHLNDGQYGNSHSWIAATPGESWAQIELPQAVQVARVVISRDRKGEFQDRIPVEANVLLSPDGTAWQSVGALETKQFSLLPHRRNPLSQFDLIPHIRLDRLTEKTGTGRCSMHFFANGTGGAGFPMMITCRHS